MNESLTPGYPPLPRWHDLVPRLLRQDPVRRPPAPERHAFLSSGTSASRSCVNRSKAFPASTCDNPSQTMWVHQLQIYGRTFKSAYTIRCKSFYSSRPSRSKMLSVVTDGSESWSSAQYRISAVMLRHRYKVRLVKAAERRMGISAVLASCKSKPRIANDCNLSWKPPSVPKRSPITYWDSCR